MNIPSIYNLFQLVGRIKASKANKMKNMISLFCSFLTKTPKSVSVLMSGLHPIKSIINALCRWRTIHSNIADQISQKCRICFWVEECVSSLAPVF